MVFKRKVYSQLIEWKESTVKDCALLIEGARRIGKTTIVKEFAKNYYQENYLYIDFKIAPEELKQIFNDLSNIDSFFVNLFLMCGKSIEKAARRTGAREKPFSDRGAEETVPPRGDLL